MTPRLILLTGPAADEAARVLHEMCDFIRLAPLPEAAAWDEVRDYWEAPKHIAGIPDSVAIEHGIREYPGGEEWLVGLVLPELPSSQDYCDFGAVFDRLSARREAGLPARLAILAPEPPPLLVERVRDWGGEMWICVWDADDAPACSIYCAGWEDEPRDADAWPEAVRAALGEAE